MATIAAPKLETVKGNLHDAHHRHKLVTLLVTTIAEISLLYGVEVLAIHLAFIFAMFGKEFVELLVTSTE